MQITKLVSRKVQANNELDLLWTINSIIENVYGDGYTLTHKQYSELVTVASILCGEVEDNFIKSFVLSQDVNGLVQYCQVDNTPDDCRMFSVLTTEKGSVILSV